MHDWLYDETMRFGAPPEEAMQWLPGYRYSLALSANTDLLWSFVRESEDGLWEPSSKDDINAFGAFVIPTFDYDVLIDLVAWSPLEPRRWLRRTAEIDLLGEFQKFRAQWEQKPLKLYGTPAAWLLSGGDGACALTENALLRLRGFPHIEADSVALGERLKRAFLGTWPAIFVSVPDPARSVP